MKITRQHMIDAVNTEPLLRGSWVSPIITRWEQYILRREGTESVCAVCAVGGALRQAGVQDEDIDDIAEGLTADGPVSGDSGLGMAMRRRSYLSALSCFFEGQQWRTRQDLVDWIEANVPEDYQQDIPT